MRIAVTGASGFLGSRAAVHLATRHVVLGLAFQSEGKFPFAVHRIDLTQDEPLSRLVRDWKPDVIVHSAAMSRVLECERDPERARAVNVEATSRLVRLSERLHCKLVFISSDQVFSGKRGGYRESDDPAPLGWYGRTKLEAERCILNGGVSHLVIRSNSIVGGGPGCGESFTSRVIHAFQRGDPVPLFFDQYRSPIHVRHLVRIIEYGCVSGVNGLLNVGGPKRMSRLEVGCMALRAAGLPAERVESVSYLSHPSAAVMTRDTSYDITRLRQVMPDFRFRSLEDELLADFEPGRDEP